MEMEEGARRDLLKMSDPQLEDVARWCNRYPDIAVSYEVRGGGGVGLGGRAGWCAGVVSCPPPHTHSRTHALTRTLLPPSPPPPLKVADPEGVRAGESVELTVSLEREGEGEVRPVDASSRYPGRKEESWWLVVGDPSTNALLAIKRVALARRARIKLEFVAPAAAGPAALTLFFMCDSYLGCDQEFELALQVAAGDDEGGGDGAGGGGDAMDAD